MTKYVSPQMTLTADELILHKIVSISSFAQNLWKITSSAVKVVWIDTYPTAMVALIISDSVIGLL